MLLLTWLDIREPLPEGQTDGFDRSPDESDLPVQLEQCQIVGNGRLLQAPVVRVDKDPGDSVGPVRVEVGQQPIRNAQLQLEVLKWIVERTDAAAVAILTTLDI